MHMRIHRLDKLAIKISYSSELSKKIHVTNPQI